MADQVKWDLKFRCPNCGVWHESDGVRDVMFSEVILCPCDHVIEVSHQVIATDAGHLPEESARKWAGLHGFIVLPPQVKIVLRDGRYHCDPRGWGSGWMTPRDPKGWAAGDEHLYQAEARAEREGWEVL